jgi:hypothetical protein
MIPKRPAKKRILKSSLSKLLRALSGLPGFSCPACADYLKCTGKKCSG